MVRLAGNTLISGGCVICDADDVISALSVADPSSPGRKLSPSLLLYS